MKNCTQKILAGICVCFCLAQPIVARAGVADSFKTREYYNSTGLDFIHAADAYAMGYTGKGIRLALFDRFVRFDHSEFAGKADLQEYANFANLGWDVNSHGTHVAGIMVASKDGIGMHGVAFDAGLVSLGSNFDNKAWNDVETLYAKTFADASLKIFNNSWGIKAYPEYYKNTIALFDPSLDLTIFRTAILNHDKVLVFAAGNSGHLSADCFSNIALATPELAGNIVNVVAFDPSKATTDLNFLYSFTEHALFVEENSIAAPGVQIYSSVPFGDGTSYEAWSGTSMAAPYVSGTMGLVQQAFPYMTGKQLVDTVLSTANKDFALPRYTVNKQFDYDNTIAGDRSSIYLVYYGNEKPSPAQRDLDLRNYYAQSIDLQESFGNADNFLKFYYRDNLYYGSDRYYTNVPRDIMFGQGLLDAGKAVRGPGLLNARRLGAADYSTAYSVSQALYKIDTQGYNSIWSNDIGEKRVTEYTPDYLEFYKAFYGGLYAGGLYGEGRSYTEGEAYGQAYYDSLNDAAQQNVLYHLPVGLIKTGQGTLALTGVNTYTGSSIAKGGVLQIDGSVMGDAFSDGSGTIAGKGTIQRNLYNWSVVRPGSDGKPGTLTVNGNFESTGKIVVAANSTTDYSKLLVIGSADINGTTFSAVTGSIYQPDATYQGVLTASNITGGFLPSVFTGMLSASGSNEGASGNLTLTHANNLGNPTERQQQTYDHMESMYDHTTSQSEMYRLYSLSPSQTKQALTEIYGGAQLNQAAITQGDTTMGKAIAARLNSIKYTDNKKGTAQLPGLAPGNLEFQTVIPLQLDADNSWWMKATKNWGSTDAQQDLPEINNQSFGFIIGRDKKTSEHWRTGVLLGYGKNDATSSMANTASQSYQLGLYGGYSQGALDVQSYLNYGRQSNDATRYMNQLGLKAESDYRSNTLGFGIGARYNLHHNKERKWQVSPYTDVQITRYNQNAYIEREAGVFNQEADKLLNTYSTGEFGIEVGRKIYKGHYGASLGYKKVLNGNNPDMTIAYSGNPSDKIKISGQEQDSTFVVLGINFQGELAKNWTLDGQVDSELGRSSKSLTASVMAWRAW